jgi:hypothetical protein
VDTPEGEQADTRTRRKWKRLEGKKKINNNESQIKGIGNDGSESEKRTSTLMLLLITHMKWNLAGGRRKKKNNKREKHKELEEMCARGETAL